MTDGLVWLASFPKSGNTWVRLFITAYRFGLQEVAINGPTATVGDMNEYLYRIVSPKSPEKLSFMDVVSLRPAVLMHLQQMYATLRPLVVKTHWPNVLFSGISAVPHHLTEKAIYIIRDPRDIVPSYAAHFEMDIDKAIRQMGSEMFIYEAATGGDFFLDVPMLSWSEHVHSWIDGIPQDRLFIARYEDMLSDPETVFGAMVGFLFGDSDKQRVRRAIKACEFGKLRRQEDKHGFHERRGGENFFRSGRAGAWRDVLSEEQVRKIESSHGGRMKQFGYLDEEPMVRTA